MPAVASLSPWLASKTRVSGRLYPSQANQPNKEKRAASVLDRTGNHGSSSIYSIRLTLAGLRRVTVPLGKSPGPSL
jgi:hypothetical protein